MFRTVTELLLDIFKNIVFQFQNVEYRLGYGTVRDKNMFAFCQVIKLIVRSFWNGATVNFIVRSIFLIVINPLLLYIPPFLEKITIYQQET